MTVKLERATKETKIQLELGPGVSPTTARTPYPFLSHMVESWARYAGLGVQLKADSRDDVEHHLIEDVALTLGRALRKLVGDRTIRRYGKAYVPMDDALVAVALDAGGRPYYEGALPMPLYEHFLRSLAFEAGLTLHVSVERGRDEHHVVEAAIKGVGMALRDALEPAREVQSTKGKVEYRGG